MIDGVTVDGTDRVIRGGSWNDFGRNARSAYRNRNDPGNRDNDLGFRFALAREKQRTLDPIGIPSAQCGKKATAPGMLVGTDRRLAGCLLSRGSHG